MDAPTLRADIDLDAIAHNIAELRRLTGPAVRFMAVVKANAYGHGAAAVSRTAIDCGAAFLGVARIQEAVNLREAGIDAPILVFGATPADQARHLIDYRISQAVTEPVQADILSAAAKAGETIPVHIKLDTGMGRVGFVTSTGDMRNAGILPADEIIRIARMPGLKLEGVFTHFAAADSADLGYTRLQTERFLDALAQLRGKGLAFPLCHAANSGAIIAMPESHLDMVRAGIAMYGLPPSTEMDISGVSLKPALSLKARVVQVKSVPAGFHVSYGMTYTTDRPTTIATVPVGYADGFRRTLSNRGQMLVHGQRAPIAGRVCMDLTLLDVGHIDDVRVGDEVVIIGRQGTEAITADDMAADLDTINYEVVSALTARVPRVYGKE